MSHIQSDTVFPISVAIIYPMHSYTNSQTTASFSAYDFPEALQHTLAHMQYTVPTTIQQKAIPSILADHDILGSAATGSGKTGAFAIPLVAKLLNSSQDMVLVLTPTRELASQVMSIFKQLLGKRSKIKTALLIGGEHIKRQFDQLREQPRVIVGTPGRVNDHIERKTLKLHNTKYLVLDETDRMLDMGFDEQIAAIIQDLPTQRQTLMFSATISNRIAGLSKQYLTNPQRVDCGDTNRPAPKITQENIHTSEKGKYNILKEELNKREGSVIIFVKTKRDADDLAFRLRDEDHRANAIHGDLQQRRRERVISDFRQKKYRIMVATDVASRGLDIPHIEHVINFNLPHCPEDYIHRIGRTARAGATGSALNFISPEDDKKWKAINRLMNPSKKQNDEDHDSPRSGQRSYRSTNKGGRFGSSRYGYDKNNRSAHGSHDRRHERGNERGNDRGGRFAAPFGEARRSTDRPQGIFQSSAFAGGKRKKYGTSNGAANIGHAGHAARNTNHYDSRNNNGRATGGYTNTSRHSGYAGQAKASNSNSSTGGRRTFHNPKFDANRKSAPFNAHYEEQSGAVKKGVEKKRYNAYRENA